MPLIKLNLQGAGADTVYVSPNAVVCIRPVLTGHATFQEPRQTYSDVTLNTGDKLPIAMTPDQLATQINNALGSVQQSSAQQSAREFPYHPDAALFFEVAAMEMRRSPPSTCDYAYQQAADAIPQTSPCYEPFQRLRPMFQESRKKNGFNGDYVGAFTEIGLPPFLASMLHFTDSSSNGKYECEKLQRGLAEVHGYIVRQLNNSATEGTGAPLPTPNGASKGHTL